MKLDKANTAYSLQNIMQYLLC